MRSIDEFSKIVGAMSCFNEMIACGCKNVALGHPTSDRALRDEHMVFALEICKQKGTMCCEENGGFLTDLFPYSMNKDKFNILFYRTEADRDAYVWRQRDSTPARSAGRSPTTSASSCPTPMRP